MRRQCADCGEKISARRRSGKCRACLAWHCERCGERMDRPRAGRLCTPCTRRKRATAAARPRLCYSCRAPLPAGRIAELCPACARDAYLLRRAHLLRQGPRPCKECGGLMPVGRDAPLCTSCNHKKRQEGWKRRPCAMCGDRLRTGGSSYCTACLSLYQNWRRAYHAGQPEARMLKPKRSRKVWQKGQS